MHHEDGWALAGYTVVVGHIGFELGVAVAVVDGFGLHRRTCWHGRKCGRADSDGRGPQQRKPAGDRHGYLPLASNASGSLARRRENVERKGGTWGFEGSVNNLTLAHFSTLGMCQPTLIQLKSSIGFSAVQSSAVGGTAAVSGIDRHGRDCAGFRMSA